MDTRLVPPIDPRERPTAQGGLEVLGLADIHAPGLNYPGLGSIWQGIWSGQVHHFVAGRLYVRADTQAPPGHVLAAEVRVFGEVCGIRDLIAAGAVSSGSGPLVVQLAGYSASFVALYVEARKLIDGLPSDLVVPGLSFAIGGRLFR